MCSKYHQVTDESLSPPVLLHQNLPLLVLLVMYIAVVATSVICAVKLGAEHYGITGRGHLMCRPPPPRDILNTKLLRHMADPP